VPCSNFFWIFQNSFYRGDILRAVKRQSKEKLTSYSTFCISCRQETDEDPKSQSWRPLIRLIGLNTCITVAYLSYSRRYAYRKFNKMHVLLLISRFLNRERRKSKLPRERRYKKNLIREEILKITREEKRKKLLQRETKTNDQVEASK
jgi:hypothetical protein